jgi:large subunit ribosomal protein L23
MNFNDVIVQPIISEKSTALAELNKYVFKVNIAANKIMVKKAIKHLFAVEPESVNVIVSRGKEKRLRYRKGNRPAFKKAIVTLKKGDKIDVFVGQ